MCRNESNGRHWTNTRTKKTHGYAEYTAAAVKLPSNCWSSKSPEAQKLDTNICYIVSYISHVRRLYVSFCDFGTLKAFVHSEYNYVQFTSAKQEKQVISPSRLPGLSWLLALFGKRMLHLLTLDAALFKASAQVKLIHAICCNRLHISHKHCNLFKDKCFSRKAESASKAALAQGNVRLSFMVLTSSAASIFTAVLSFYKILQLLRGFFLLHFPWNASFPW